MSAAAFIQRARSANVVRRYSTARRRGPGDALVDLGVGERLEGLLDLAGRRVRRRNGHETLYHSPGARRRRAGAFGAKMGG